MAKLLIILLILASFALSLVWLANSPANIELVEKLGINRLRLSEASPAAQLTAESSGQTITNPKTQTKPSPTPDWSVRKVDEHLTEFSVPVNEKMSTSAELFEAVNAYRRAHGLNTLTSNTTICEIARKRAEEQLANGGLDNHAGFGKYGENQNEFTHLGEVLYGGQPLSGVHIVEFGWDRSLTGHREALQNPNWQIGCGGVAGFYAAFVFANN